MKKRFLLPLPLLATLGMALAMPVQAKDLTKFSSSVVEFQMKLARNGNPLAQYKLGSMYESGQGVEQDEKQAIEWYKKSAAKGHEPAKNRLTFMEIKRSGYKADSHKQWLNTVKRESDSLNASAMILLADMHILGIGVNKNPKKALNLLKRTSAMGNSEVDGKIEALELDINKSSIQKSDTQKIAKAEEEKRKKAAAKKRADDEKRRKAAAKAKQDRQLAQRRRLEEQRRQQEAEKRRAEEQKRKLVTQKRQPAPAKEDDSGGCTGAAARFRTTCR